MNMDLENIIKLEMNYLIAFGIFFFTFFIVNSLNVFFFSYFMLTIQTTLVFDFRIGDNFSRFENNNNNNTQAVSLCFMWQEKKKKKNIENCKECSCLEAVSVRKFL